MSDNGFSTISNRICSSNALKKMSWGSKVYPVHGSVIYQLMSTRHLLLLFSMSPHWEKVTIGEEAKRSKMACWDSCCSEQFVNAVEQVQRAVSAGRGSSPNHGAKLGAVVELK